MKSRYIVTLALCLSALVVASASSHADPFPITQSCDLNDNLVPPGFDMTTRNAGGIADGHMWACPYDGLVILGRSGTAPAGFCSLELAADDTLAYSTWNMRSRFIVHTASSGTYFMILDYTGPGSLIPNLVRVSVFSDLPGPTYTTSIPAVAGRYHLWATLQHGSIDFSAEGPAFLTVSYPAPNLNIADVTRIEYQSDTTGDNCTWMDNLFFRFEPGPSPARRVSWGRLKATYR